MQHLPDSLWGLSDKIGTIQRRLAWPLRKDSLSLSRSLSLSAFPRDDTPAPPTSLCFAPQITPSPEHAGLSASTAPAKITTSGEIMSKGMSQEDLLNRWGYLGERGEPGASASYARKHVPKFQLIAANQQKPQRKAAFTGCLGFDNPIPEKPTYSQNIEIRNLGSGLFRSSRCSDLAWSLCS